MVTLGEWREVTGTSPSYFNNCGDGCPVERVSWYNAVGYTNELSRVVCYQLLGCGEPSAEVVAKVRNLVMETSSATRCNFLVSIVRDIGCRRGEEVWEVLKGCR